MHQDLQGTSMTPLLQLKCKCLTAHHQTRTHHPASIKTNQVAWPHKPFQLLLLHMETSEWLWKRAMIMEEHPDMTKVIEILAAQVEGIGHHTIGLAQDITIAKVREKTVMVTINSKTRKLNTNPVSTYQQGAEDEDWDEDLDRAAATIQQAHQLTRVIKLIKKMLPHQMTTPSCMIITQTLLNLSLAVTQAENSLPAGTPPMMNYKAALSLRKRKIWCYEAEWRPACPLTFLQLRDIRNCPLPLLPRKVNRATEPTWIGWLWRRRNSTKNNRENGRNGSKCPLNSKY